MHLRIYQRAAGRACRRARASAGRDRRSRVAGRDFMDAVLPGDYLPARPRAAGAVRYCRARPRWRRHGAVPGRSRCVPAGQPRRDDGGTDARLAHQRMESLEHAARILLDGAAARTGDSAPRGGCRGTAPGSRGGATRLGSGRGTHGCARGGRMSHETQGQHQTDADGQTARATTRRSRSSSRSWPSGGSSSTGSTALEARRSTTPDHVFDARARRLSRPSRLGRRAADGAHRRTAGRARVAHAALTAIEEEQQQRRDERAEAELRAHVGELSAGGVGAGLARRGPTRSKGWRRSTPSWSASG